jgi:hypothetical protein
MGRNDLFLINLLPPPFLTALFGTVSFFYPWIYIQVLDRDFKEKS